MAINIWRKQKDSNNIPARITRLDKPSLLDWYNTTLMELGASFDRYRHHGSDLEQLDELMEILNNLHKEIGSRERNNH